MITRMKRQAYKSKVHETFLAKHAYTPKGPNSGVEMISRAIEKRKKTITYHMRLSGLATI